MCNSFLRLINWHNYNLNLNQLSSSVSHFNYYQTWVVIVGVPIIHMYF